MDLDTDSSVWIALDENDLKILLNALKTSMSPAHLILPVALRIADHLRKLESK